MERGVVLVGGKMREEVCSPIYCSKDCIYVALLKRWLVADATLPQEKTAFQQYCTLCIQCDIVCCFGGIRPTTLLLHSPGTELCAEFPQ